jgi:CheY-like chemotaxis protein
MNLMVLKALMKRLGTYELETAMDGKAALERLQRTDLPAIDVVLTDMWMPEMDGEALAKAIRADARLAKLPVYVITADVELEDNYSEKGFDDIVLKPVTIDSLSELLMDRENPEGGAA